MENKGIKIWGDKTYQPKESKLGKINIQEHLRKGLLKEDSGDHGYGCIMLYLSIDLDWWLDTLEKIDEDDIYDPEGDDNYSLEKEPHITVLYGIHNDVPDEDVEELIEKMTAPEITLKKIGMFDNADKGFDVVKFDIESPDLTAMNEMFKELPYSNDYPKYHAHATIGYVKAGTGEKYTETLNDKDTMVVKPTKVVYSKADGSKKEYEIHM